MTNIICPLCGRVNPPELDECQYCQAPLKTGGFLSSREDEGLAAAPFTENVSKPDEPAAGPVSTSNLEQAVPDWLKETEAGFLAPSEPKPEEPTPGEVSKGIESLINLPATPAEPAVNAIDDEWLESLLAEAGAVETLIPESPTEGAEVKGLDTQPEAASVDNLPEIPFEAASPTLPTEKPDWLASLEASSKIKLEGGMFAAEPELTTPELGEIPAVEAPEEESIPTIEQPEWLSKPVPEAPAETPQEPKEPATPPESPQEQEPAITPAELPGWLEVLRPADSVAPTGPVEDVSGADIVTAGPLVGLRGVLSAQPSAIRVQKPPTYSIKLRVTEEQQSRLKIMEEMLADEGKPKPLPTKPMITSRYIFRLIVAIALLLPIIWMIVSKSQSSATPQPADFPGVVDFSQHLQALPANAPVLVAFDYEAGFSGEMNPSITNVLLQLMKKNVYMALVSTTSSGPALAESMVKAATSQLDGNLGAYQNYANLGYIPGGTMGLLGLAASPRNVLPYALDERNVWSGTVLKSIATVQDFAAVIVMTNDPDTARIWIEQVGTQLRSASTPLLLVTSSQAEPLVRPYYEAAPAQVQGLIAGLAGGVAFASILGNYRASGFWDAYSAGITISILIILIGSAAGVIIKMMPAGKAKKE